MTDTIGLEPDSDAARVDVTEWNKLCQVMNGYIYSQTLATACELDLFTILESTPGLSSDDVAQALDLSPYGARVLLLACCAAALTLRTEDGKYSNSPLASKVLVRESAASMLDFIRFNHDVQRRCSVHLTAALRERRNAGLDEFPGGGDTLYARLTEYPDLEQLFQRAMGQYTRLSPRMMRVPEFAGVRILLDIGGGDGSNAIRLCQQYPGLTVRLVDIPSVVTIAEQRIAANGLQRQIECQSFDMFEVQWPKGHDAVLLSHVVEIFAPEQVQHLYRSAYSCLPPRGRVFVWTLMANDTETGGLQAAKSSIYFLSTASGRGMPYPGREHERWLAAAGFRDIIRYDAHETDHGAIIAAKPAGETE